MADAVTPPGGSVQQTTNVALPLTSGLAVAMWAVNPTWPPPEAVLILVVGWLAPLAHMFGRAIYRKVASWAGEPDPDPTPSVTVVVPPPAPAPPPPAPPAPPPLVNPVGAPLVQNPAGV